VGIEIKAINARIAIIQMNFIPLESGVSNTGPANSVSAASDTFKIQKVLNISTKNWGFIGFDNK
jgi:hypothetical protein